MFNAVRFMRRISVDAASIFPTNKTQAKISLSYNQDFVEDLSSLLSDTENMQLMEMFDNIDKNQDSFINKEEYLAYQRECYRKEKGMEMPGYQMEIEERTVADMDRKGTGTIDWWNFLIPMCARKLAENKHIPITWLTKQELYKLREIFKRYDQDGRGEIGRQASRRVFKTWYLSLIDLPPERVPIWEWLGTTWFGDQRGFPLE
ncbi:PREDICTED: calmodulin-like isoform X2 [Acropora digitifera]|uniref:calmodulin-like isoform X2 n=1 Tax=Acropora digitifera TaxID=70779 RepID=UPI00077B1469|nr:PREDICTED: calmodulin-like isoform X2 [Acropora digitifera]